MAGYENGSRRRIMGKRGYSVLTDEILAGSRGGADRNHRKRDGQSRTVLAGSGFEYGKADKEEKDNNM